MVLGDTFLRAFYTVYTYEPVSGAAWVALAPAALGGNDGAAFDAASSAADALVAPTLGNSGLGRGLGSRENLVAGPRSYPEEGQLLGERGSEPAQAKHPDAGLLVRFTDPAPMQTAAGLAGDPGVWDGGFTLSRPIDASLSYWSGGDAAALKGGSAYLGKGMRPDLAGNRRMLLCA